MLPTGTFLTERNVPPFLQEVGEGVWLECPLECDRFDQHSGPAHFAKLKKLAMTAPSVLLSGVKTCQLGRRFPWKTYL